MPQHASTHRYVAALPVLCFVLVFCWLRLIGISVQEFLEQGALTVTGYLRPRPDPLTEHALRTAFAELDKELANILGDRIPNGNGDPMPYGSRD